MTKPLQRAGWLELVSSKGQTGPGRIERTARCHPPCLIVCLRLLTDDWGPSPVCCEDA